jgi:asparagine synthetase B (glutamine-hydrolysing)
MDNQDDYAPWNESPDPMLDDEIRTAFTNAVQKHMMADVDYGFFLSGGIDKVFAGYLYV